MIFINFGGRKKKLLFCLYFRHISLCFYSNFDQESSLDAEFDSASNEYPHCILLMDPSTPKTRNTWKMWWWFDGPRYPKNKKYLKKRDDDIIITFFQVFLVFKVAWSVKSMQCGYSLDVELNSASNEYPLGILLTDPTTPKTRNTWKNVMMTSWVHFNGLGRIFLIWIGFLKWTF